MMTELSSYKNLWADGNLSTRLVSKWSDGFSGGENCRSKPAATRSPAPDFRALEADFDAINLLGPAGQLARGQINLLGDFDPMDVHAGVIAALGEHIDQHRQRERIIHHLVFRIDVG